MWVTRPRGRGLVSETRDRVHAPATGRRSTFEDAQVRGVQRVRFETDGVRTRITVAFDARAKEQLAPAARVVAAAPAPRVAASARSQRFSYELAAERDR